MPELGHACPRFCIHTRSTVLRGFVKDPQGQQPPQGTLPSQPSSLSLQWVTSLWPQQWQPQARGLELCSQPLPTRSLLPAPRQS